MQQVVVVGPCNYVYISTKGLRFGQDECCFHLENEPTQEEIMKANKTRQKPLTSSEIMKRTALNSHKSLCKNQNKNWTPYTAEECGNRCSKHSDEALKQWKYKMIADNVEFPK